MRIEAVAGGAGLLVRNALRVERAHDPARHAVAYLDDLFRALDDDLEKALAGYNAGGSLLRRLQRAHPDADFWDPRIYFSLPAETRDYVPRVLAASWLFLHGAEYGLDLPRPEATITDVMLREDLSLGELTICLGQRHAEV